MSSIKVKGLVPQNGERCKKAKDENRAVYFFDYISNLHNWIDNLYPEHNKDLYLLRFSIKKKHWYVKDLFAGEYYLKTNVSPKQIKYLKIQDIDDYLTIPAVEKSKCKKLLWVPLEKFQEEKDNI